jgi:hypothetical protein
LVSVFSSSRELQIALGSTGYLYMQNRALQQRIVNDVGDTNYRKL